jgi:hypothetical protein
MLTGGAAIISKDVTSDVATAAGALGIKIIRRSYQEKKESGAKTAISVRAHPHPRGAWLALRCSLLF